MAIYTSLRATAQRLIQKNGRTITYTIPSTTLVDVNNPQLGTTGSTTETPKMAFISDVITEKSKPLIQQGDKIALLAADDLTAVPSTAHTVTDDNGTIYNIQDIESIDPSEAPVVYQLILRG